MLSEAEILDALERGLELHQAGQVQQAAELYERVLAQEPDNPDALHLLGVTHHQRGAHSEAAVLIERAIAREPAVADYHNNLGEAYSALTRPPEAIASYRRAIELEPGRADAHYNLGRALVRVGELPAAEQSLRDALRRMPNFSDTHRQLGTVLAALGRSSEAEAELRQAAALRSDDPDTFIALARLLHAQKRLPEAVEAYRRVVLLRPQYGPGHGGLGFALYELGRPEEAAASVVRAAELQESDPAAQDYLGTCLASWGRAEEAAVCLRRVATARPDDADVLYKLGNCFIVQEKYEQADAFYKRAIAVRPDHVETLYNLGNSHRIQRRHEEAIECYRRAIPLDPTRADLLNNLGISLQALGRHDEAIAQFHKAIELRPDHAEHYSNLGNSLHMQGRHAEVVQWYRKAIEIRPNQPEFLTNLGNGLRYLGKHEEAIEWYRRALQIQPNSPTAFNNLGNSQKDLGRLTDAIESYRKALVLRPEQVETHSNLLFTYHYHPSYDAQSIFEEHLRWARQHADPVAPLIQPHANDRTPGRRLRVGYVSPDFRTHSVGFFIEPVLATHDKSQVEVFCYSDVGSSDAFTRRIEKLADQWRNVYGASTDHLTELIRRDEIDILVDLSGHSSGNRMPVFARKPAPVQVTYLGYPDTTGLPTVDYRITDSHADPPGATERFNTEELVRLDPCAWCYQPPADGPPVGDLPAMGNGYVTFGSFNFPSKITDEMIALWCALLSAMPRSRMVLKNQTFSDPAGAKEMRDRFARHGVDDERLILLGRQDTTRQHLEMYHRLDIALDTFPYHGTTTTCEALWMGLPVVSIEGKTHVSRVGVSLLKNVGLAELLTQSPEQYVQVASALANDLPRLAELRRGLRQRLQTSPIMDRQRLTRDLEKAYRRMWERWCGGEHRGVPETSEGYLNLGNSLIRQGRMEDSLGAYQKSLELDSQNADAMNNLGNALQTCGRIEDAVATHQRAVALRPSFGALHNNLGNSLRIAQRYDEAAASYHRAIELQPGAAEYHGNLGNNFTSEGKPDRAIECFQRAIELAPDRAEFYLSRANALLSLGRNDDAVAAYRQALALKPDFADAHSGLLLTLHYADYDLEALLAEHVRWGRQYADPLTQASPAHANDRSPDRTLRVGLVSADFKKHPVGFFVEPVLAAHDRARFEMICYSDVPFEEDVTQQIKSHADGWRNIAGMSDERVARAVRDDRIDILIDLAGHTAGNRLLVFARKPAPVQISQFGYPDTTGMAAMDYRVSDPYADPPGENDRYYIEELIRLPHVAWCYRAVGDCSEIMPPPVLASGRVTFGSLNNLSKVTDRVLELWAKILQAVPGSRLIVMQCGEGGQSERVRRVLVAAGVEPDRVQTVGKTTRENYLQHLSSIDIALDPFPYNGGVTTCDALWMGLPVVTLAGKSYVSRQGVSLLSNVGLQELIARTPEEYILIARRIAEDLPRLSRLRQEARARMASSPLTDGARYVDDLQKAYREVWRRWCAGHRRPVAAPGLPADAYTGLGSRYQSQGRVEEAIAAYRQALSVRPDDAETLNNIGNVLYARGEAAEAIDSYQKAIRLDPNHADAHNNLANCLLNEKRYPEADVLYQRAIALQPKRAQFKANFARSLRDQGRHSEAVEELERVLETRPNDAAAYSDLGESLRSLARHMDVIKVYQRAIAAKPDQAEFHNSLGNALHVQGGDVEAINCYRRALELKPEYPPAHNNLGNAYKALGRHDEAIAAYRKALSLDPDFVDADSNLLFALHYHPSLDPEQIFEEHRRWVRQHAQALPPAARRHDTDRSPERRLRVGYVSGDFKTHSVGFFIEPVLVAHDHQEFEVFCYSDGRADPVTARLQALADRWRSIAGKSQDEVGALIQEDAIDILVDLSGYTAGGQRMLLFARKPAPLQVTYLGYPNTTALPTMDYRITDSYADPKGMTERFNTEELVRLDLCAWCYQPSPDAPAVARLPAMAATRVTFGSFNASAKLNPALIELWSRLLLTVPESRLFLKNKCLGEAASRDQMMQLFAQQGVEPDRLELQGWALSVGEHLEQYNRVDIGLDSFPYHGTTTTCEALWMGVPVVSLQGMTHVSRVGVSLLSNVGLDRFIAQTPEEYVRVAADLASDLPRLAGLREGLRERMRRSPLMDRDGFVRRLESAYRAMWRNWCAATQLSARHQPA